jgi:hypothetical protein
MRSLSRISRIICTALNGFLRFFRIPHLLWRPDLQQRMTMMSVHGVVAMNPLQVHDVPEIPAHEDVNAADGGTRDVAARRPVLWLR